MLKVTKKIKKSGKERSNFLGIIHKRLGIGTFSLKLSFCLSVGDGDNLCFDPWETGYPTAGKLGIY